MADDRSRRVDRVIDRYSAVSAERPFDPFSGIEWSALESAGTDPRWHLPRTSPFVGSTWWGRASAADRRHLALAAASHTMAVAIAFENGLQSALLRYAATLSPGSAEFRYVHHEIIEESRHSQMFGEFLRRVGFDATPADEVTAWQRSLDLERIAGTAPEVLFTAALAGEEPIDQLQRALLQEEGHPVLLAICRRHVAEEARHIGYARHLLRELVPRLDTKRRRRLQLIGPTMAHRAAWLMAVPSPGVLAQLGIDDPADPESDLHRPSLAHVRHLGRRVQSLFGELGLGSEDDERWRQWRPPWPPAS